MFQKYIAIIRIAKTEKIIMQLPLRLRSQCFTYVLYKYLHINLDILGKENGKSCNLCFL